MGGNTELCVNSVGGLENGVVDVTGINRAYSGSKKCVMPHAYTVSLVALQPSVLSLHFFERL